VSAEAQASDIATAVVLYALADAVTPGPWISADEGPGDWPVYTATDAIVGAREDVPWLVSEVERLTAERDALAARVAQVESLADHWAKRAASDYEAGGTLTWGAADVHFSAVLREALAEPIGQEVDLPLHRTEAGSALDTMGADQ